MFPLGSVLFPSLVLPLHVFEPRYRALTLDVLAGDQEFGVVLIERGSEVGGDDVRTGVGTVARVLESREFDDGRWALHAVGVRRFRVDRWLDDAPYPRAEVTDIADTEPTTDLAPLLAVVTRNVRQALAKATELGDNATPATIEFADDASLASLQLAALAPLSTLDQQFLLAETDTRVRLESLDRQLADVHELLDLRLAEVDDDTSA